MAIEDDFRSAMEDGGDDDLLEQWASGMYLSPEGLWIPAPPPELIIPDEGMVIELLLPVSAKAVAEMLKRKRAKYN